MTYVKYTLKCVNKKNYLFYLCNNTSLKNETKHSYIVQKMEFSKYGKNRCPTKKLCLYFIDVKVIYLLQRWKCLIPEP